MTVASVQARRMVGSVFVVDSSGTASQCDRLCSLFRPVELTDNLDRLDVVFVIVIEVLRAVEQRFIHTRSTTAKGGSADKDKVSVHCCYS